LLAATLAILVALAAPAWSPARAAADTLPDRLSDADFWALSQALSEPDGDFRSDNLVSNEIYFQSQLSALVARTKPGGVYLGVGPEQNFTYIAALRPKMVFITDIRRGNLHTQLMYKALFELSADRAEFVSRLFSKPRPPSLTKDSTALEIMDANYVDTSGTVVFEKNASDIIDLLTVRHELPLSPADRTAIIQDIYYNFYWFGPALTYGSSSANRGRGNFVTFHDLMVSTDNAGVERSFLASEEHFRILKDLHARNLIVPVVGDLAGPTMVRADYRPMRRRSDWTGWAAATDSMPRSLRRGSTAGRSLQPLGPGRRSVGGDSP
jgi:hypothetical protein